MWKWMAMVFHVMHFSFTPLNLLYFMSISALVLDRLMELEN